MAKASTGLRTYLLGTGSLVDLSAGGYVLNLYNGTPPATADAALSSNTLIVKVDDGFNGGIAFNTPSGGSVTRDNTSTMEGTVATTGTPTFFRLQLYNDDDSLSTTNMRIQGTVGTVGTEDLVLVAAELTETELFVLGTFTVSIPAE